MKRGVASVLAVILLAGCGGGDSQSGASAPIGGGTPAPAPAPAPPPATVYDTAFDFTSDRTFGMLGAEASRVGTFVNGGFVVSENVRQLSSDRTAIVLDYDAGPGDVHLDFRGDEASFSESLLEVSRPDSLMWRLLVNTPYRDDVLIVVAPTGLTYAIAARQDMEYDTTDGTGRRLDFERYMVGGSYTLATELPRTGSKSYPLSGSSSSPTRDGAGGFLASGTASFDFSGTAFTATVELEQISSVDGNEPVTLTAELSGTVNFETNVVEGQIASPNSAYTGGFSGAFFGPSAEEFALVYTLGRPGTPPVAGSMVGTSAP